MCVGTMNIRSIDSAFCTTECQHFMDKHTFLKPFVEVLLGTINNDRTGGEGFSPR